MQVASLSASPERRGRQPFAAPVSGYWLLPMPLLVTCREALDIMGTILLILLVLLLIGAIPSWPYSRNWGFAPCGVRGVVLGRI